MKFKLNKLSMKHCCLLSLFLLGCWCARADVSEYNSALATFKRGNVRLWLNSSLAEKMAKLRDGKALVVFEGLWKEGKSIVQCDFTDNKYLILKADGGSDLITKTEFNEMCEAPSLVSYEGVTYLNVPSDVADPSDGDVCLGKLMFGGAYNIFQSLVLTLPRNKIQVKFVINGYPAWNVCKLTMSDDVKYKKVVASVRKMLEIRTKTKWKAEYDAKLKKLPRKPPVVYGTRNVIVKRSDGTFEIPHKAPPKSKTITWTETVYAEENIITPLGEQITTRIPTGTIEHSREKPLTQMYDYDELVTKMKEYDAAVEELKNDRPPEFDDTEIERILKSGHFRFVMDK